MLAQSLPGLHDFVLQEVCVIRLAVPAVDIVCLVSLSYQVRISV